jgi:pimeloyl-ACP methyl ester carboxylesterase
VTRPLHQRIWRRLRLWAWGLGLSGPRPQLVLHDGTLMLNRLAGRSDRLVLVFTSGRGRGSRLSHLEFARVAGDGGRNHVLFVTDLALSWYSRPGMRAQIAAAVQDYIAAHGIREVRTIGVSMGGFGAILFAGALPVSRVAAFVPQIEMTPAAIAGPSWDAWRAPITAEVEPSVAPVMLQSPAHFTLLFGDQDADDNAHRARVPRAGNITVLELPGEGHDVAANLADRGRLGAVAMAMLAGGDSAAETFRSARIRACLTGGALAALLALPLPAAAAAGPELHETAAGLHGGHADPLPTKGPRHDRL